MIRFAPLAALFLAACTAPVAVPTDPNFVPYLQAQAENPGKPYECLGYDPATDTCRSLGRTTVNGTQIMATGSVLNSFGGDTFRVTTSGPGTYENGFVCLNGRDLSISARDERTGRDAPFLAAQLSKTLEKVGKFCSGLYRHTGNTYRAETVLVNGTPNPAGQGNIVTMFAKPKKLRPFF